MSTRVESLARQLREECYAVVPGLYPEVQVRGLREVMLGLYRDLGAPRPYCDGVQWLAENLELSATGFVIHKLLGFAPALQRGVLPLEAVEIVRGALGADMHLEMVGGVVSDHTRPFFQWHMHVGGIDDEVYRRRGLRPTTREPERVAMLVYLDEMREDTGQLLVHPRRITDPIDPPHPVTENHWPGEVAVTGPPGTVVMMEQSTWHAVLPRRVDTAPRLFVGFWFASAHAPRAERVDESLFALTEPDEVLASVLPRGGPR